MRILTSLFPKSLKFCEIPEKIGENLTKNYKICCLLRKSTRIASNFAKNSAKVLKNQRNLEWCKGKNVELEKCWKMRPWTQKSALIQLRTNLRKCLKNGYSKGPRWLYLDARNPSDFAPIQKIALSQRAVVLPCATSSVLFLCSSGSDRE